MSKLYIPLERDEARALVTLANREKRDPRLQAALFVRLGLERAGLLEQAAPKVLESDRRQGATND